MSILSLPSVVPFFSWMIETGEEVAFALSRYAAEHFAGGSREVGRLASSNKGKKVPPDPRDFAAAHAAQLGRVAAGSGRCLMVGSDME